MAEPSAAPEQDIARDIVRRAGLVGPVLVIVCSIVWGLGGFGSSLYALALVVINFVLGASMITWGIRISPHVLLATVLGGYFVRLAIITGAYFAVRGAGWFDPIPFAITLLASHGILLVWETRHVSMSLAYPGLKPRAKPEQERRSAQ